MSKNTRVHFGPKKIPWMEQVPEFAVNNVSPPSCDPKNVYTERNFDFDQTQQAINGFDIELPPIGQTECERQNMYDQFTAYTYRQKRNFLGYQTEEDIHYQTVMAPFLDMSLNDNMKSKTVYCCYCTFFAMAEIFYIAITFFAILNLQLVI